MRAEAEQAGARALRAAARAGARGRPGRGAGWAVSGWAVSGLGWVLDSFSISILFPILSYFYFKQGLNSNENLNSNTLKSLKMCTSMNATSKFIPMIKF